MDFLVGDAAPLGAGVGWVADDRVPEVLHVDADLMGAAGAEAAAEKGCVAEALGDFVVGNCLSSVRDDRHSFAIARIAADCGFDRAAIIGWRAVDESEVLLADGVGVPLRCQLAMGVVMFCDEHHAARVLVEAVHDAGAELTAHAAEVVHVMEERIDERLVGMSGGGMDYKTGGLVDDGDVVVLIEDGERQILLLHG